MVDVAQVLEVLDAEMVPLHEKHARHEAVRHQHAHAGEVVFAEGAPQRLVEAADAVVGVGGGLAVGDAVEEVAVVGPFLPHPFHLGRAGLEVAEVLLAQPGFFVYLDGVAGERGGGRVVGGQGVEDAFGGLAGSAVGAGEEVEGVVGFEEGAELEAGFFCLDHLISRHVRDFWRAAQSVPASIHLV